VGKGFKPESCASKALVLIVLFFAQISVAQNIGFPVGSAAAQVGDISSNVDNREVSIVSVSSRYDSELGAFHIFGELINGLDTTVRNVGLNATFYDAGGNIIGNAFAHPYIDYLRPQEKSGFDIAVYESAASEVRGYSYYKVLKSWDSIQDSKLDVLDFDLRNIVLDTCGFYEFSGTIGNFGNEPANDIALSAVFYNERNQMITSALSLVNNDESLQPIKYKPFTMLIDGQELSRFAYYSFNIQSDEYASRIFEKIDDDSLDYQNGFPKPSPSASGMSIMTVSAEAAIYGIGTNNITVFGTIPIVDEEDWNNNFRNSLVLIKVLNPSGAILGKATAPVLKDGSYSTSIDFRIEENTEGQVYRVRAEYKGNAAENNFSVAYGSPSNNGNENLPVNMTSSCAPADVSIGRMSWIHMNESNSTNHNSDGEVINAGSSVTLSIVAENRRTAVQPLITIIQVFDGAGKAVFINLDQVSLGPNTEHQSSATWTPDLPGKYRIESFLITGLDEPRVLSRSISMTVRVV
jgi:hypothetical protein